MKERKTLGLLINDIDGSYQTYLWILLKQAAEELDCNLIVLEGRSLRNDTFADRQHHIIYNFIEKERIDGLVITSGSIANYISDEEFLQFCKKYIDIPIVSLGVALPDAISLIYDNKEGMKSLIRHLADEHGYKKIIFVTGPESNSDSIERFEAYKEVLAEKNIAFDKKLIFHGDFVSNTGYAVMEQIIQSNLEYDAIVFANDDMALGAIKCIKNIEESGRYILNKKIIICGFDDSLNASRVSPPLTTVRQPLREMCYKAIEMLINGTFSENKGKTMVFPSVMVKRASCGCFYNKEDTISNNSIKLVSNFRIHENIQTYAVNELFNKLTPALKQCYVQSCFVFKYVEGPIFYDQEMAFDESFAVPLRSEMIFAYYEGERKNIDESSRIIKTTRLLPDCFIPKDRRFTYIVKPLFFENEHFGFICFSVTDSDVMMFEMIRGQISNTLKGALLLMEREHIEESLRENERLASLGQLIGGISHNLMTPIMSIAGVCTALEDLIDEYGESVGDSSVTNEDHYEIKSEMAEWVEKLKDYNAYMSNVIATVKAQAVQLNSHSINDFTVEELVNRIKFLKASDITIKKSKFELFVEADTSIVIKGDISNMIQILDNLIKNAIQSYEGKELHECRVELYIRNNENMVTIIVKDYGKGISDEIKSRLFKYMVTTKGKNGTGLSLLLSYSTIKGKFGGEIWFNANEENGTDFYVSVPIS
ncbi:MAG: HTH-type transcriptional regulator AscG [Firmicutes bacterium ADurb.Bin419]|nr:MAG: HTH-type transcriptional regulator AscG [Firmicutes bacterium ADurb.Bin419]